MQISDLELWDILRRFFWWKIFDNKFLSEKGWKIFGENCWRQIFGRMGGAQLTGGVELTVGDKLTGGETRLLTRPIEAAMLVVNI